MPQFFFILFAALLSTKAFACASFVADSSNQRSGGSAKHFFSHLNEQRRLILKNETNEPCEVRLEALDLLQRLDGGYQYAAFQPGRTLYRSLSSGLSIIDTQGNELLWVDQVLRPNEVLVARIAITNSQPGTSYTAVRAYFPKNPVLLALTEIYFTKDIQPPRLSFDSPKYVSQTESVEYTLKGRGDSYTFVHLDLKLIDPATGFEVDSFFPDQEEKKMFVAYIKNYWLPGMNNEKIIKSSFKLGSFTRAFISQFQLANLGTPLPEKVVLYIRPRFGIDTEGWKNHFYLSLPGKTVEINLSKADSL
ncbi:hypothetical protein ACJVC5_08220 [Peredibacter sp. HCB2-198]|uniref:hypothetical protein n=1 Tax=Peredibacter sp. HCB2-198 TaxID=3383025 RepID=UPI0038B5F351